MHTVYSEIEAKVSSKGNREPVEKTGKITDLIFLKMCKVDEAASRILNWNEQQNIITEVCETESHKSFVFQN